MKKPRSPSMAREFARNYLSVSLFPLAAMLILVVTGAVLSTRHVSDLIQQSNRELHADARHHLSQLGQNLIRNRARDVAAQIAILIRTRPGASLAELNSGGLLESAARQHVGQTGYTCLYEAHTAIMRIHPNPDLTNRDMRFLATELPSWWKIFEPSLAGVEISGFYDWLEPDGSVREKYMTMTPVDALLNGRRLMVAATTYIDEFSAPVVDMQAKAGKISENYRQFITHGSLVVLSVAIGLLLCTFAGVYLLGRRAALKFIVPIERLARAAEQLGEGRWETAEDKNLQTRRDEIGALATAFYSMRSQLRDLFRRLEQRLEELNQTQEALKQSEKNYRSLFDRVPVGIYRTTPYGEILESNPALIRMLGYPDRESFIERSAIEMYPDPEDRNRWKTQMADSGGTSCIELRMQRRDGSFLWVENYSRFVTDADGQVQYYEGSIIDITQRKHVEAILRENEENFRRLYEEAQRAEELYRSLLNSSADAIVIYNMTGEVQYLSPSFTRMFGWSLEELEGRRIPFVPKSEAGVSMKIIRELIDHGTPCHGFETQRYTKDGRTLDISISGSRYMDHEGRPAGMLSILRDISDTRRLEAQIQRAQRLEAIGTLAGGIAHDFNNLLMGIQGRVSLLMTRIDSAQPEHKDLQSIENQVHSATELTRQILGFARGGKYEAKPTDINTLVRSQDLMFGRTRKEIRIKENFEPRVWTVEIDRGQIEQVLLNLYVNAWQAMPDGGELRVATANVELDDDFLKPFGVPAGRYVKISVSDTGIGMDRSVQERIFDPFFTTKEMGRGTGLGLASTYGIIKSHAGFITVRSAPQRGTTFDVYLPVTSHRAAEKVQPRPVLKPGQGRILVVDDEEVILEITREMLSELGYEVLTAGGGREAIEIFSRTEGIDLVILDIIMPDMDGSATYRALRRVNDGVRVLISSGYSIDGAASRILELGASGFIQKPFTIAQLSQKISAVLNP